MLQLRAVANRLAVIPDLHMTTNNPSIYGPSIICMSSDVTTLKLRSSVTLNNVALNLPFDNLDVPCGKS